MRDVFVKTPKGIDEMTSRAAGLTPRVRRVLIMLDGQRTVEDIRAMALVEDLSHALGLLEASGFIEKPGKPSTTAADSGLAFRDIPDIPEPKELDMAKNFIMNSLRTFCGPSTHLSIIEAAFAARTHEELREQFAPWLDAIIETRDGRRRSEELQTQLLKVI